MIYLIGAVSIISLFLNVLIYRKILASDALITFQELTVETIEPEENEAEVDNKPLPPIEEPITVPMVQEAYQGWRNQSNVSWTSSPPSPSIQPKTRGPLERPDGFV